MVIDRFMFGTAREVLTDPDGFFEERVPVPSLRSAAAVVTSYVLLEVIAVFLLFTVLLRGYSLPLVLVGFFGLALSQSVIWFGTWLLYAAVFQIISYFLGGKGSFRQTFTVVGWGYLPLIAGSLVSVVANAIIAQGAPPIALQSPQQATAAVQQLRGGLPILIANIISSILSIWSAYIWVFALKHARDLSTRQAVITVVVPVVIFLAISLLV